jgi:type II secretory pathway pseudopilin PulG
MPIVYAVNSMTEKKQSRRDREAGLSMIEILLVVLIGMIVMTIALPNVLTVLSNTRLRSNISTLSGIFQNCRMMSVRNNRVMTTHFSPATNGIMAYVKLATDGSAPPTRTDTQVELEAPIIRVTPAPSGPGAPTPLDSSTLGFTPLPDDASFNTRGLPCLYSVPNCTTNQGFIYYFKDTRQAGSTGWAAVSISPAGRIKKWYWHGSVWGE